ncbi:MAG: type IV pilus assembly protein PilM [Gloeomargarita sp. SKYG116]|nr:type IV pilus assembly protein PilM [Gloeomargarita sp. SKYG116]MCS7226219.1 type IV pilus assembly protein PilM [Gloeomargarita sp. SKYB31]MDW8401837.1 type IV pilus assembly protein PilM [Gloeomargarita sp. SKYGB_i_bin116]
MTGFFGIGASGVGIEITLMRLQIAQLQRQRQGLKLVALASAPMPEGYVEDGLIVDREGVGELIKNLMQEHRIKAKRAALAIPSHRAVTRIVQLPAELDDVELRENVENEQAALFLPYPREEADLDFQKLGLSRTEDDQELVEVLLAATRKETTDSYMEAVQAAGLTVRSVETTGFALLRTLREQLRQTFTEREAAAIVDIGYDNTEISIVVDGVPKFARDVPIGVLEMQNAVSRAASMPVSRNPNWAQTVSVPEEGDATSPTNRPGIALVRVLQELADELRRSIDFYRDQPDSVEVVQILLAGPGAAIGQLDEYMSHRLGIAASCVDPIRILNLEVTQEIPAAERPGLGVVLGLALREV